MTAIVYSVLVSLGWVCPPVAPPAPEVPTVTISPVERPANVRPWKPKTPPPERR